MNDIRVTYSGLIALILGIVSIALGFGFILIVTRTLDTTEYGTWGLISGIIVYATVLEHVISYWTTREIARDENSGKTSIFTGLLFSLFGIGIYLISAYIVGSKTDADQNIVILGIMLIPLIFLNRILDAISLGWKPQGISYGQIVFGISQIPAGFLFIYFLKLGTAGVIYSVALAYTISIIFLLIYNREKIYGKIRKNLVSKWIKFSGITLYPVFGGMILFLDVVIFSLITESVIGLAFWTASITIATVIASSGLISRAVYSKLLQGKDEEFLSDSLRLLFYFSIPFMAIVITFAKPGLFALNPEYIIAEIVVIILAIQIFLDTITGNIQEFITGTETVDKNKKSKFKDYLKSKLFFMPTINLVQVSTYITLLTIMLLVMTSKVDNHFDLLLYWAIVALIVQIPISIYTGIIFKRDFSIELDNKSVVKYFISAIMAFGITYVLINSILIFENNIFMFIPQLLAFAIFGITSYIGITYIIDIQTRFFIKSIITEVWKKKR